MTALSTQEKLFLKSFNGHHTEGLRAEIFHAETAGSIDTTNGTVHGLPRFNRPSAINVSMKAVPKYEF